MSGSVRSVGSVGSVASLPYEGRDRGWGFRPISNPHNHVSTLPLRNPHPGPPLKGEGAKKPLASLKEGVPAHSISP